MKRAERLFDHGIQNELSDIRAHVSSASRSVYVFQTSAGLAAVRRTRPPEASAGQPGVAGVTGKGWLVRLAHIEDLRTLRFTSWSRWPEFDGERDTSRLGALAVACVLELLRMGRFPLWIEAEESRDRSVQVSGTDVVVAANRRIQVKCDRPAGKTGNLFLQFAECNPLQKI